jgi:hypothetical protein
VSTESITHQVTADPGLHDKLVFWLNGTQIAPTMTSSGDKLEGVVSGLVLGDNRLEVRHRNGQGLGVSGANALMAGQGVNWLAGATPPD